MTSRFHQPAAALGWAHVSGSANWTMRPRRWRSAWAIATSCSRSIVKVATVPVCSLGHAPVSPRDGRSATVAEVGGNRTVCPMRVLICPDKFRGTLTARQAAAAFAAGWAPSAPHDEIDLVPMADGGEGTLDALVPLDGERRPRPGDGSARRSGRGRRGHPGGWVRGHRVGPSGRVSRCSRRNAGGPRRTTTRGVGDLMRAALEEGARRLLVVPRWLRDERRGSRDGARRWVSGWWTAAASRSPTAVPRSLDAGPHRPVGARPPHRRCGGRRAHRRRQPPVRTVRSERHVRTAEGRVGGRGGPSSIERSVTCRRWSPATSVSSSADEAGAGAAGGLGFGLLAFCGAHLRPGVEAVGEARGLEARIAAADLVITGEGALDATSLRGKVVGYVLGLARDRAEPGGHRLRSRRGGDRRRRGAVAPR